MQNTMRCFLAKFSVAILLGVSSIGLAMEDEPIFGRDVLPILSDRCFLCHGPNEKDRQANLRLDRAEGPDGAYREEAGTTAIKPGSLQESELWLRISSHDPDAVMPPPDAHKKPLSKTELELFQKWISARRYVMGKG